MPFISGIKDKNWDVCGLSLVEGRTVLWVAINKLYVFLIIHKKIPLNIMLTISHGS